MANASKTTAHLRYLTGMGGADSSFQTVEKVYTGADHSECLIWASLQLHELTAGRAYVFTRLNNPRAFVTSWTSMHAYV